MTNRLGGLQILGYRGTEAIQPPNWRIEKRDPTSKDIRNVSLGDLWLNKNTMAAWILVSLARTLPSQPVLVATWLRITSNFIENIVGNNTAVIVLPDGSSNINLVGDGTTITIAGTAGSHLLTMTAILGDHVATMTGNSGGAVSPSSANNINLIGDGTTIKFTGNPLTNTLTASIVNPLAFTMTGNSGGSIMPDLSGNINLVGDGISVNSVGNPGSHTITLSLIPTGTDDTLTGDSGGAVSPGAGNNISLLGGTGISVIGTPGSHLLTINGGSAIATTFQEDVGTATPSAATIRVIGGTNIVTSASGNTVIIGTTSTITGITSLTVNNLTVNNSATFGYLTQGVVQSNGSGVITSSEGTDGQVLISSSAGAPAWANITAGGGIGIVNGNNSITISQSVIGGNGWDFIGSFSGATITNIPSYKTLVLVGHIVIGLPMATTLTNDVHVTLSSDNGVTYYTHYLSGANLNDYRHLAATQNYNITSALVISPYYGIGSGANGFMEFTAFLYDVNNTNSPKMLTSLATYSVGSITSDQILSSGVCTDTFTGPINALKVGSTGGSTSVTITASLYGLTS
jgi:hypothetical protein